jgi:hypothetical protein
MGIPRKQTIPTNAGGAHVGGGGLISSSSFSTPQRTAARSIDNGHSHTTTASGGAQYPSRNVTPAAGGATSYASPGLGANGAAGGATSTPGGAGSVRDRVAMAEAAAAGGREKKDDGCVIS